MTTGIYKIENLINHKVYIGQSIHIERRWTEHCNAGAKSLIGKAIQKYGKENFSFQILEECSASELDEKEQNAIIAFNSLAPNGYNIVLTGPEKSSSFVKYDINIFNQIVFDIEHTELTFKAIASKYDLDLSMIYYINRGDYHTIPNKHYPLRQVKDYSKKEYFCIDCGTPIHKGAVRCLKCAHIHQQKCERPSRSELKKLIRSTSFVNLGKQFGVSDNAIRKWCKNYNLPSKRKDINNYSDLDWEKV